MRAVCWCQTQHALPYHRQTIYFLSLLPLFASCGLFGPSQSLYIEGYIGQLIPSTSYLHSPLLYSLSSLCLPPYTCSCLFPCILNISHQLVHFVLLSWIYIHILEYFVSLSVVPLLNIAYSLKRLWASRDMKFWRLFIHLEDKANLLVLMSWKTHQIHHVKFKVVRIL